MIVSLVRNHNFNIISFNGFKNASAHIVSSDVLLVFDIERGISIYISYCQTRVVIDIINLIDKVLENNFISELVIAGFKQKLNDAIKELERKIARGEVEYEWYGRLNNYSFSINCETLVNKMKKHCEDEIRAFYALADEYLQLNEEFKKKKEEESKNK